MLMNHAIVLALVLDDLAPQSQWSFTCADKNLWKKLQNNKARQSFCMLVLISFICQSHKLDPTDTCAVHFQYLYFMAVIVIHKLTFDVAVYNLQLVV